MDELLRLLRAAAEPTRLRLLSLCAQGEYCVTELVEILGQSQPRLSRHLKLLAEAGALERAREGANVFFRLPAAGWQADLARTLLARLAPDDAVLAADRRNAARVAAERARAATDSFRSSGADWDETTALGLSAAAIEALVDQALGRGRIGALLDIGTGTGRLLEALAPRCDRATGVDASRAMLALARTRLSGRGLDHVAVRHADMYRLPFPDRSFDAVTLLMVLHFADDPAAVLAEAARVLRPGGRLVVADLAAHDRADILDARAHRWPGFDDAAMAGWLGAAGLVPHPPLAAEGALPVRVWSAAARSHATAR
jgi:ArsR family transcriptional regulator